LILIIANARYKGGLSGSDNIYLHFAEHWKEVEVWDKMGVDFRPFTICYIYRVLIGIFQAIGCGRKYDFVYSASDFWPDCIPAFILKLKGNKWIAGFYLFAPKDKSIYFYTQKLSLWLINHFADKVCITNGSLVWGFKNKKIIEVNGGVDLKLAEYLCDEEKRHQKILDTMEDRNTGSEEEMRCISGPMHLRQMSDDVSCPRAQYSYDAQKYRENNR